MLCLCIFGNNKLCNHCYQRYVTNYCYQRYESVTQSLSLLPRLYPYVCCFRFGQHRLQELWPAGIHAELGGGNASFGIITCVLFFQFVLFLSFHLCGYCSLFVFCLWFHDRFSRFRLSGLRTIPLTCRLM